MVSSEALAHKPLISVERAAALAGISRSTAYAWAQTGQLAGCVQIGSRYHVRTAAFLRWLNGE